jgi:phospholipid/cholesterol/gamma-HCH transport system substrate-binding protein
MKISKELKIGVFVVTVLTASFFLINYLRGKDIFNKEIELTARYQELDGLVSSAPVFIKGFKAGKVVSVSYDPASDDFLVTCSVLKDFSIPVDSKMTIYGVDIMGGKGIRIDLGTSEVMVEDGGELAPSSEPALLDGLAEGVAPLMDKVGRTLDSLNVTVSAVNRLLADENISRTLTHIERTMADVRSIAADLEGKSDELNIFIDNLASLSLKFISIAEKADTIASDVTALTAAVSDEDVRSLVSSFRELLENINDPDGSVGKLLTDGSVYDSVDELLDDVDSLVRQIQENPKKYIKISVF